MELKQAIMQRRSVRKFLDENVQEEHLLEIFKLATTMPSAHNNQITTIMYTMDKEKIEEIAKICGGQEQIRAASVFMLFVTDMYRAKLILDKKGYEMSSDLESVYKMAKIDAGLMVGAINLLAVEYGYGCTVIGGGIYNEPEKLKKLFNLPEECQLAIGMTMGVPHKTNTKINEKPKLEPNYIVMKDEYNYENIEKKLFDYDIKLDEWFKKIGVTKPLYSDSLANVMAKKE